MIEPMSHARVHGLGLDKSAADCGAWWCPSCSLLVTAEKNPVLCDECDGDMTIAPEKFWRGQGRAEA